MIQLTWKIWLFPNIYGEIPNNLLGPQKCLENWFYSIFCHLHAQNSDLKMPFLVVILSNFDLNLLQKHKNKCFQWYSTLLHSFWMGFYNLKFWFQNLRFWAILEASTKTVLLRSKTIFFGNLSSRMCLSFIYIHMFGEKTPYFGCFIRFW